jgi:imidazolonepropionase-like amidohydrolase
MKRAVLLSLLWASVASAEPIAFTHVTLIDGRGGPPVADATVVIDGDRVVSVDRPAPPGARVVDAKGKYLIPGLWDAHVHWFEERLLPLFIANG